MKYFILFSFLTLFGCIIHRTRIAYYPFRNDAHAFLNLVLPEVSSPNIYYKVQVNLKIPENPKEEEVTGIELFWFDKYKYYLLNPEVSYWEREYGIKLKSKIQFPSGSYPIPIPTGKNQFYLTLASKEYFSVERNFVWNLNDGEIVNLTIKNNNIYADK